MTSKQNNDDNQRFRDNLRRELRTMEHKRRWKQDISVGMRAVSYFGSFFGGFLAFVGLMWVLYTMNVLRLTLYGWIGAIVVALGILVIVASIFVARIMPYGEFEDGWWHGFGPTAAGKVNKKNADEKGAQEMISDDRRND